MRERGEQRLYQSIQSAAEVHRVPEIASWERLMLSLENPFIDPKIKNAILFQYISLPDKAADRRDPDKKEIKGLFEHFVYDPGLDRNYTIHPKAFSAIHRCDRNFRNKDKKVEAVKLYNRSVFIRIAKSKIIEGKHSSFINFDLKNIRQADNADYAEHLLRSFGNVLLEAGQKHQIGLEVVPGRVGGDEFSIFVSSDRPITREELGEIYEEVKNKYQSVNAYIAYEDLKTVSEMQLKNRSKRRRFRVRKTKTGLTHEFILPEGKDEVEIKRKIVVYALHFGQMPEGGVLAKENRVGGKAFHDYQEQEARKMADRFRQDIKDFRKIMSGFFQKHPEFPQQQNLIEKLLKSRHTILAQALFFNLVDYLDRSVTGRRCVSAPQFFEQFNFREKNRNNYPFYQSFYQMLECEIFLFGRQ